MLSDRSGRLRPARDEGTVVETGVHHVCVSAGRGRVGLFGTRRGHFREVVVLSGEGTSLLLLLLGLFLRFVDARMFCRY